MWNINSIKGIFFVGLLVLPVLSFAERVSIKTDDGRLEYFQKDLLRLVDWSDDISLISQWSGNASEEISIDGFKLGRQANRFGCKVVSGKEQVKNPYLNVYLEFRGGPNNFGLYAEYPEG